MVNKKMRILDAKHNKELIGEELKFQYIIDGKDDDPMTLKKLAEIVTNGFARIDARIDKVEADIREIKMDIKRIDSRIDNLVKKNNLKE
ncbi:MAG: hypothetical protein LBV48_02175 [Mycoplasmataceae bacterium]|jgi:hypothetical protein|nr:hypothetical protein [Mycoplasmataceae bacterium]